MYQDVFPLIVVPKRLRLLYEAAWADRSSYLNSSYKLTC